MEVNASFMQKLGDVEKGGDREKDTSLVVKSFIINLSEVHKADKVFHMSDGLVIPHPEIRIKRAEGKVLSVYPYRQDCSRGEEDMEAAVLTSGVC